MGCLKPVGVSLPADKCFGGAVRWEDYGLPCPSIASFDYEIDAGLVRTPFESGYHRQRRRYTHRPTYYQITWSGLTTSQLQAWELFTQEYGFDWFYAPLITGQVGRWRVVDHLLRFIDNPQVSLQQKDRWAVSIAAEQQKIDPDCMFELQCDEIIECLEKAHLPPVIVDWTQFSAGWGNKAKWGAPNG